MLSSLLLCLSALLLSVDAAPRPMTRSDIINNFPPKYKNKWINSLSSGRAKRTVDLSSPQVQQPIISPVDFGADPTGQMDASDAFRAAMDALLNGVHTRVMADGITDLGGAVLDLSGGEYLISEPIHFPPCYGNARIQRGTLRASPNFPQNEYLIKIGNDTNAADVFELMNADSSKLKYPKLSDYTSGDGPKVSCHGDGQGVFAENIGVEQVMLDGSHVAAGGVVANRIMGATLSELFISAFTVAGVTAVAGHEVEVYNTWIAQYYWSENGYDSANATGVQIFGNDHLLEEVIVFSSSIGVHTRGAANLITSTHTWNKAAPSGVGIYLQDAGYTQNRVVQSYLDYNHLVTEAPEHLVISEMFFLASASVEIRTIPGQTSINGLTIIASEWDAGSGDYPAIIIDEKRGGPFTELIDVEISGNQFSGFAVQSAASRTVVQFNKSKTACADLSSHLLFAQFALTDIQLSVAVEDASQGIPTVVVDRSQKVPSLPKTDNRQVCLAASQAFTGQVFVDFDQASKSWPKTKSTTKKDVNRHFRGRK